MGDFDRTGSEEIVCSQMLGEFLESLLVSLRSDDVLQTIHVGILKEFPCGFGSMTVSKSCRLNRNTFLDSLVAVLFIRDVVVMVDCVVLIPLILFFLIFLV